METSEQKELNEYDNPDFKRAMDDYEEARRKRAIKALFERDAIAWEAEDFNNITRAFCWLKTLICLLLKRTRGSYLSPNSFCILAYDEYRGYESYNWEAVWVSSKLFSGWQVCIGSDGT